MMTAAYQRVRDDLAGKIRDDVILRLGDMAYIPADDENLDWQRFEAWQAEGNAPSDPPVSPPPVPDGPTLSDWRVALIKMGRFADVQAAVIKARDSGSVEGQIAWQRFEYANNVYRAELLRLAPVMGFTAADIDQSLAIAAQIAGEARAAAL